MSFNYPILPLCKLVTVKGGKRLPNGSNLQKKKNNHPYIRVRDMGQRYIPINSLEYVPDDVFPDISRYTVEENNVILSIVGTIGLISIIDSRLHGASLTENCAKLSGLDRIDALYLYYYLNSPHGQQEIKQATVGAVQAKLPLYNIEKIQVLWPARPYRERIVSWLSTLDDKIELNYNLSHTLEMITQAIFKSWFVDFEPVKTKMAILEAGGSLDEAERAAMCVISSKDAVALTKLQQQQPKAYAELAKAAALFPATMQESELGMTPDGWRIGTISELIEFNPKRTLKKGSIAPYLDMKNVPISGHLAEEVVEREMVGGTKFINGDTLLARITPCLENGKTAYVDFLREKQVGWGSTEYIVLRPRNEYHSSLGYFIARNDVFRSAAIRSMNGTSGRQRASVSTLADLPWLIYPKDLISLFAKVSNSYLTTAKNNGDESKTLAQIRGSLLSKLLSGETELNITELNSEGVTV